MKRLSMILAFVVSVVIVAAIGFAQQKSMQQYIQEGKTLMQQKRYKEALYMLDRARQLGAKDSETYYLIGKIHSINGNYGDAIVFARLSLKVNPNNKPAKDLLISARSARIEQLKQNIRFSPNDSTREDIEKNLLSIDKEAVITAFSDLISEPNESVKLWVAQRLLFGYNDRRGVPILESVWSRKLLEEGDQGAAEGLAKAGINSPILEALNSPSDYVVAATIMGYLKSVNQESKKLIVKGLIKLADQQRLVIKPPSGNWIYPVVVLGEMRDKDAVPVLTEFIESYREGYRKSPKNKANTDFETYRVWDAILALGEIGDERGLDPLINLYSEFTTFKREMAPGGGESFINQRIFNACAKIKDKRAVPMLLYHLAQKGPTETSYGTKEAIYALGEIGDTTAVPELIDYASVKDIHRSDTSDKAAALCVAFGKIKDPRAIPILCKEACFNYYEGTRKEAINSLGEIGDPRAIPLLKAIIMRIQYIKRCYAISSIPSHIKPEYEAAEIALAKITANFTSLPLNEKIVDFSTECGSEKEFVLNSKEKTSWIMLPYKNFRYEFNGPFYAEFYGIDTIFKNIDEIRSFIGRDFPNDPERHIDVYYYIMRFWSPSDGSTLKISIIW
jgi:HEAT repeat protein